MSRGGARTGTIDVVAKALREVGPMTLQEMVAYTGFTKSACSHALCDLNKPSPRLPKRAYILEWVYDHEGQKNYPRAVFGWGNYPDAQKPKRDTKLIQKRYRQRKLMKMTTNSVFNLAGVLKRGSFQIQI